MKCPKCNTVLQIETRNGKEIRTCNNCEYLEVIKIEEEDNKKDIDETYKQYDLFGNITEVKKVKTSKDSLKIYPLSVFDSKQGKWLQRKKDWKKMFKFDYEGRKTGITYAGKVGTMINEGISVFDPVLCELSYKWFCPKNGKILDPFAGGAVRGIVAEHLGFKYTGIDLSEKQIGINNKKAEILKLKPKWIVGNSLDINKLVKDNDFDFFYTCPPYYNLEHYTEDSKDLSNYTSYNNFLKEYKTIIHTSLSKLKNNRFAGIVVGNFRDNDGFVHDFAGDTTRMFEEANFKLYNDCIYLQAIGTAYIRSKSGFKYRKIMKIHQHLLIYYKGITSDIPNVMNK